MNRLAGGNPDRAKALAALMLTAKGVPFIYYGDEIGMQNIKDTTYDEIVDVQGRTQYQLALKAGKTPEEALAEANKNNRDKSRSPMQWNESKNAGFTIGKPWIKVNENFKDVNVQREMLQDKSILSTYKALIALRNNERTLQYGKIEDMRCFDDRIRFTRTYEGDKIAVIINFGEETNIKLPSGTKMLMGHTKLNSNEFLIYRFH
jgi:trehalose-6-phosphate hydrolase